jgi:hypothetical protein
MSGVTFQVLLAGGSNAVKITNTSNQQGTNSYTVPLGTPFSGRVVVVAVVYGGLRGGVCNLAGNAMTSIISPGGGSGSVEIFAIIDAVNSSAGLSLPGSGLISSVSVYTLQGVSGISAFATAAANSNTTSLNVPQNGGLIACGWSNNGGAGYTFTAGVTSDQSYNDGGGGGGQGHREYTTAVTPQTVTFSSLGGIFEIAAASWKPA